MSERSIAAEPASRAHVVPAALAPAILPRPLVRIDPAAPRASERFELPENARPLRVLWHYAAPIAAIHVLALLAFFPWLFSWTGWALAILGCPFYGLLGITLCYHRVLTHQGLTLPKWLERSFALLGVCTMQDTPARWVAIHRAHHKHSDERPDPHTPLVNFFWSHMGWLLVENREHNSARFYEQYAKDILRDPFYFWLERGFRAFWIYWIQSLIYFAAGLAIGWIGTGELMPGVQFGTSLLIWGVFVRTIIIWHFTWTVNSIAHVWGYRNYETGDDSRNHWLVSIITYGEGWHNNHHADQRAAMHGHHWWEYDPTYWVVRFLEIVGLAKDVVRPRSQSRSSVLS